MSVYQPPYNFQAVYRAYPEAILVDDERGAFDKDNNEIVLEQSKIDTALAEITELEKQNAALLKKIGADPKSISALSLLPK